MKMGFFMFRCIAGFFNIFRMTFIFYLMLILTFLVENPMAQADSRFSFDDVMNKAKEEAARPFSNPEKSVPEFLLDLTYDQWRDIRFLQEKTLWRMEEKPFQVQFFHPGLYYNRAVIINTVSHEGVKNVPFSTDLFDYGANRFQEKIPSELGFAGLRILYPLNTDKPDDIAVFLGASYFRAVGKNQAYGLSARGLAIDTGQDSGEEFPYFKEFWIEEPDQNAQEIVIYALLDSKRLTGAYRFTIRPGENTKMLVEGKLFKRDDIEKIGIAPLTSMFFYGENTNQRPVDDFRPEIHDSDGLQMVDSSGEKIWRPLINPQHLFINSFQSSNIKAFGLLQRDRDFDHYQDQETRYDSRPSALVVPVGDWGSGHVELVQIPTENETNDNIVAYWVPDQLPPKGEPIVFSYVLSWHLSDEDPEKLGRVIATRNASGKEDGFRKIIIDFKGGKLDKLPAHLPSEAPIEAVIEVNDEGEIIEHQLYKITPTDSWRLVFQLRRKGIESIADSLTRPIINPPPLEIQAHLTQGDNILTETWSYAIWP